MIVYLHGIYSCRISTALLAITVLLIRIGKEKTVEKWKPILILTGPVLAAVVVTVLSILSPLVDTEVVDIMLAFGETQDLVNLGVLLVSLITTAGCLVQTHRASFEKYDDDDGNRGVHNEKTCQALKPCSKKEDVEAAESVQNNHTPQIFRHTLLLLVLCCSMFSGSALSTARIQNIWDTKRGFPGVYKVLVFLDTFLASGQGLLFLGVFALDCKYILLPISKGAQYLKRKVQGQEYPIPTWISMEPFRKS